MLAEFADFNGAERLIADEYKNQWEEVEQVIGHMPLHVSGSDQAGIQGNLIFNPKGTNAYLKDALLDRGWEANIPIPAEYRVLGTDVDFVKDGVLLEVQFSNYPFLSNNVLRSEMFYKARISMGGDPVELLMIITKARMFPASQSTLYYEQAVNQLRVLAGNDVFDMPVRVVGLFEERDSVVDGVWTGYRGRTSRTEVNRESKRLRISSGRSRGSRSVLAFAEDSDPPSEPDPSLFPK
jgi:hypothetical protein